MAGLISLRSLMATLACGCLLLAACKETTAEDSLKAFLEDLRAGQFQRAWDRGALGFQTAQSIQLFESSVKDLGLSREGKLDWTEKNVGDREATFKGTFQSADRPLVHLEVRLIRESGEWKVSQLGYTQEEAREGQAPIMASFKIIGSDAKLVDPLKRKLPSDAQIRELVKSTLLKFNEAIQLQDFTDFHSTFSREWQKDVSVGRVQRAFQPFIDAKVDLKGIADKEPVFVEPPRIAPDGMLSVSGYYEIAPFRAVFVLRYAYELPKWRLHGMNCRVDDMSKAPPTAQELEKSGVQALPGEGAPSQGE